MGLSTVTIGLLPGYASIGLAGIFGASLAPYVATALASRYGLPTVGYYLAAAATLTLVGLLTIRETKDLAL